MNADTPEIGMAIKEQYRGKGLGTNLINHIVDKYAEMGLKQLSLNVNQLNPAKRLYERCGFTPFSEQEDSVIMTRQLL